MLVSWLVSSCRGIAESVCDADLRLIASHVCMLLLNANVISQLHQHTDDNDDSGDADDGGGSASASSPASDVFKVNTASKLLSCAY